MTEREQQALNALLSSKKYKVICRATVVRAFETALTKHKSLKDADKAARAHLHQIAGAFLTENELRAAMELLPAYLGGGADALNRALRLHASTRERLAHIDALYDTVFAETGAPDRVLDLACGLNPLYLGARGVVVEGYDIHGGAVDVVNRWAENCGWAVRAHVADALLFDEYPPGQLALVMKLLPVLEQQRRGASKTLLSALNTEWKLISFPTRTLGGRRVGMEQNYGEWFEALAAETEHRIVRRFTLADELCFIVRKGAR